MPKCDSIAGVTVRQGWVTNLFRICVAASSIACSSLVIAYWATVDKHNDERYVSLPNYQKDKEHKKEVEDLRWKRVEEKLTEINNKLK